MFEVSCVGVHVHYVSLGLELSLLKSHQPDAECRLRPTSRAGLRAVDGCGRPSERPDP